MNGLPPMLRDQRMIDADHLRLLAVFHFVFSALAVVGLGFLALHYAVMQSVFMNPETWKTPQGGGPSPVQVFAWFRWFYLVFAVLLMAGGAANLMSGLFMRERKNRIFSLVVAGLNCLQVPFGTVLGVFTIVVLLRDSVREAYERKP